MEVKQKKTKAPIELIEYTFPDDEISYLAPNWQETGKLTFKLAQKIIKDNYRADRLVVLAKGGWSWSRALIDYLNIPQGGSLELKFYKDINQKNKAPVIVQSLPISVQDERILIFDDVADSGETLKTAKRYLQLCGAKEIKTATLFFKSWSSIEPDFWSAETKSWVIFPHEIREAVTLIGKRWRQRKLSKEEILKRFSLIGLPTDEVRFFLKLLKFN